MTAALAIDDPVLEAFADEVGVSDPVGIAGGKTRWSLGGELQDGVKELAAPSGIVKYQPEEMTVKVRAGTPVDELHLELAAKGQRTALPERGGTVGGALAVGENDIRALGRGRVREALLQVRYVSAEGRLVSSGGPTVKNVSGFDLPRLMVGSLGTLGLIAEVILRTNPIPAVSTWVSSEQADPTATFNTLLNPSAVLTNGEAVWVELVGHEADVATELALLASVGRFTERAGPPTLPPHRWSLTPAQVLDLNSVDIGPAIGAVGLGLAFGERPQPPRPSSHPSVDAVNERIKANFDPTGRLNPGRDPRKK